MRLKDKNITQRASDLIRKGKNREEKKPLLAALSYYTSPFFAGISHGPDRTPPSHREHGQGILSGLFMGRRFLGLKTWGASKTFPLNRNVVLIIIIKFDSYRVRLMINKSTGRLCLVTS
jgi:hypothetical protein